MARLTLKYYPDPILLEKTRKVTRFDSSLRKLAQDMLDTMYASAGVGLAAPQVGIARQLMVIDIAGQDEPKKPLVFINPVLKEAKGEMVGLEGCLSFPEVFFEVRRFCHIVVSYQDLAGKVKKLEASNNLLCRAVQHEMDHLQGKVFIDKAVSRLAADLELTKHGFLDGDVPGLEQAQACAGAGKLNPSTPMIG